MRIVNCPKGDRIPEGYCKQSCLNYPGELKKENLPSQKKINDPLKGDGIDSPQFAREDAVVST
jgi:hypothetical protein